MAYNCFMESTGGKYIFPDFSNTVLKSGEYKIDYKASQMFGKFYQQFYAIIQHYRSSE